MTMSTTIASLLLASLAATAPKVSPEPPPPKEGIRVLNGAQVWLIIRTDGGGTLGYGDGGPFQWEPLLYLAYARHDPRIPADLFGRPEDSELSDATPPAFVPPAPWLEQAHADSPDMAGWSYSVDDDRRIVRVRQGDKELPPVRLREADQVVTAVALRPPAAGRPGAYTGAYGQVRLDWTIDRATSFAVEAVHFAIGDALRNAGGHDSNYIGVEIKRGW